MDDTEFLSYGVEVLQTYNQAVVGPIANPAPTIYDMAIADLRSHGLPGEDWDRWSLLNIFNAVFSLPDRPGLETFLLDVLACLVTHERQVPLTGGMFPMLVQVMANHSTPRDPWLVEFLLSQAEAYLEWPDQVQAIDGIVKSLGQIRDKQAIEPLLNVLHRKGKGALALANLGAREAIGPLIGLTTAGCRQTAIEAVEALGHLQAFEASGAVLEALQEGWKDLEDSAGQLDEEEIEYLVALLKALPKLKATQALGFLRQAYPVSVPRLQVQVALALSRFGDDAALAETVSLWERELESVERENAMADLSELPEIRQLSGYLEHLVGGLENALAEQPADGATEPTTSLPPGMTDRANIAGIFRKALTAARSQPGLVKKLDWCDLWDIARRLVELSDERGLEAMTRLYWRDDQAFPQRQRDVDTRQGLIRTLGDSGDWADVPFLDWVQEHDLAQTAMGYPVGEEARRAAARIKTRLQE